MYILDAVKNYEKDNAVDFYLSENPIQEVYGDDWGDAPYEHNAGNVYDEFVDEKVTIEFPPNWVVLEPADDACWDGNTPYCKLDMRDGMIPCMIAVPTRHADEIEILRDEYVLALGNKNVVRYYMGDRWEDAILP